MRSKENISAFTRRGCHCLLLCAPTETRKCLTGRRGLHRKAENEEFERPVTSTVVQTRIVVRCSWFPHLGGHCLHSVTHVFVRRRFPRVHIVGCPPGRQPSIDAVVVTSGRAKLFERHPSFRTNVATLCLQLRSDRRRLAVSLHLAHFENVARREATKLDGVASLQVVVLIRVRVPAQTLVGVVVHTRKTRETETHLTELLEGAL